MDDILASRLRRGHSSSSAPAHDARGRAQLRQHHFASFDMRSSGVGTPGSGGEGTSSSGGGVGVNKIWRNVRRSLSVGGRRAHSAGPADAGMLSTPEETLPPPSSFPSAFNSRTTSPTVEQIAMGLHISRTPHLRAASRAPGSRGRLTDAPRSPSSSCGPPRPSRPPHLRRGSAPPISLPPPPARSSLKKPPTPSTPTSSRSAILTPSDSNASLSTLTTSTAPSTPRSQRSSSIAPSVTQSSLASRLQLGMKLLLPTRKNSVSSISDADSASSELTPRKVVRFSVLAGEPGDKP